MDWIANTETGLDPKNSVIKRLWCITVLNKRKVQLLLAHIKVLLDKFSYRFHVSMFDKAKKKCCVSGPPTDHKFLAPTQNFIFGLCAGCVICC